MTRCVLEWLETSVQRRPEAVSFEDDQTSLSYQVLYHRARAIGTALARRVAPQSPVLILMDKTPACIAAMLGAVYAGCFYTPVDPAMPQARMALIAQVLRPAVAVCDAKLSETARGLCESVVVLEDVPDDVDAPALEAIRRQHMDNDLLYVLFTSGSTGLPKGVSITHRSVVDFIEWAVEALDITPEVKFGNQAPLYFDNSVLDVYCALCRSACVHFIPRKHFLFPGKMTEYLVSAGINTIFWVPSAMTGVASAGALEKCPPGLTRVYFCGETMPCKTLNAWKRACPEAKLVNMYGPTEITDVCTYFPVERDFDDGDALPIGFPCANTRILLIDGEICVTGVCLSPGYYNAPERTQEAFVLNPLRPEIPELIYKTGDLGAYNERGELMFLGRKDSQIKRHGYRIELGEIECALCALPGIDTAACLYDAEKEQIVCFCTGEDDDRTIRRQLRDRLPKYMIPDVFIHKKALPRTGNGKIDRMLLKQEWGA